MRDAPGYLGMDERTFNHEVRPYLTKIKIGLQGVGFDRLELNSWFEDYKNRRGWPPKPKEEGGTQCKTINRGKRRGLEAVLKPALCDPL